MNTIKNIVTAIIFLCGIISFAQVVEGKVIYKVTLNNEAYLEKFKKESTLEEKYKKINIENMSNTTPVNFFLFFKGNESVYKSEFDLDELRDMGMKWNETGMVACYEDITYCNIETKDILRQYFFLKGILISAKQIDWELTKTSKKIGDYTCYLATGILTEERETGGYTSDPVSAWYTPQIPVPFGIQNFIGLPGLTLELTHQTEEGTLHYSATNIDLHPKEKISIIKPSGKIITHEEFIEVTRNH